MSSFSTLVKNNPNTDELIAPIIKANIFKVPIYPYTDVGDISLIYRDTKEEFAPEQNPVKALPINKNHQFCVLIDIIDEIKPIIPITSIIKQAILLPNFDNGPAIRAPNIAAIGIIEVIYPIYSSYLG